MADSTLDPALPRALELLRKYEGFRSNAYPDPASPLAERLAKEPSYKSADPEKEGAPWTIGYGATGPSVKPGVVWPRAQAEDDLARRVSTMLAIVRGFPSVATLPADAVAALASLAYNIGCPSPPKGKCRRPPPPSSSSRDCCCCKLETSGVLAKVKAGDLRAAALAFSIWNTASGKVNPVLMRRRLDERSVFAIACGVVGLPTT